MKTQKQGKPFSDEAIDVLLKQGQTVDDINGLLKQFTKAVLERARQGELTHHLGYAKPDPAGDNSSNSRNGVMRKTLKGELDLETPRDRNGEFAPQIVQKNQTRWTGFEDKILSMYARGMTTREIQGHLEEIVSGRSASEPDQRSYRASNRAGAGWQRRCDYREQAKAEAEAIHFCLLPTPN